MNLGVPVVWLNTGVLRMHGGRTEQDSVVSFRDSGKYVY